MEAEYCNTLLQEMVADGWKQIAAMASYPAFACEFRKGARYIRGDGHTADQAQRAALLGYAMYHRAPHSASTPLIQEQPTCIDRDNLDHVDVPTESRETRLITICPACQQSLDKRDLIGKVQVCWRCGWRTT